MMENAEDKMETERIHTYKTKRSKQRIFLLLTWEELDDIIE